MSDLEFALGLAGKSATGAVAATMAFLMVMMFVTLAIYVVIAIGWMKLFVKCGREGWAAFVPIYNLIVLAQIVDVPVWYLFIPFLNIYGMWKVAEGYDEKFGKNGSMKIILFLFPYVGYPILGFGKDMPEDAEDDDEMPPMGPMPMGPTGGPVPPMGGPTTPPPMV